MKLRALIHRQWGWTQTYSADVFGEDFLAAIVVTILLVPQCLAYALLAGLPPQLGIYASIFPLVAYAAFGSSNYLNVGPTAVISLMTATAIAALPEEGRILSAAALALITGAVLMGAGVLKAGFLMNFVSRPVVSAYITGAALLIILSQLKNLFGVSIPEQSDIGLLQALVSGPPYVNLSAVIMGGLAFVSFLLVGRSLPYILVRAGMRASLARIISRMAPILIIVLCVALSAGLNLHERLGLEVVGVVPAGLPSFALPAINMEIFDTLLIPAIVIAIVAFVDSTSTAQELASRKREEIDTNRELLGIGAANAVAGMTGGYPINGSMSRSAVNFTAGGKTPAVGLLVAGFMAASAVILTPLLYHLPLCVLAALIISACTGLIDFKAIWKTWVYSQADGLTAVATCVSVLAFGVQWGVLVGVVLAMALHIRQSLQPNMPLVGRFPGTEHYRDASIFNVETDEFVKTLRVDEGLYYANARILEARVASVVHEHRQMTDLVLMCSGVNHIDASALSSLENINRRLRILNVRFHLSSLQNRVRERLYRSDFMEQLHGEVFLSQHDAMTALQPEPDWGEFSNHIDIH